MEIDPKGPFPEPLTIFFIFSHTQAMFLCTRFKAHQGSVHFQKDMDPVMVVVKFHGLRR